MKVTKDFAPLSFKVETEADLKFLQQVFSAAYKYEAQIHDSRRHMGRTDLQERMMLFGKDLGITYV